MAFQLSITGEDWDKEYLELDDVWVDHDAYYHGFFDNTLPEAGAVVEAGIGRVKAHVKGVGAEYRLMNVSAGASTNLTQAEAMVGAEVASVSVSTDPLQLKVGGAKLDVGTFSAGVTALKASAGVKANHTGVKAMAKAEALSVTAKAGPVNAKLGLGIDSGVSVGEDGLDLRIFGTGVRVGRQTSISLLNSEVGCGVS